ncbi:MAG TPA: sigma-70 family RNA polymerase sigma factor [Dermatophilaceae bacterium]|jgi:RNA polymerase sigma-70 factor (ECF subfamily)|nr:sigma-70 family RNA polymerase sigma factor [Actinomycetales bacterium]HMT32090.1 sigma-70 family RNA polymerase sigma factor [Dermatophilaceae bacterium]HMT89306.1 sigma-70 family RNA polymerase sigma factor [Dermatophilaceae bacterium]
MGADVTAVRDFYEARYGRLVVQLTGMTGNRDLAEEALQEAFVRALDRPQAFVRLDNPEAWLRTVALNYCRSRWRRMALWRRTQPRLLALPQDQVALSETQTVVLGALAQLPVTLRQVAALHYLSDLSVEQVAHALDLPSGTVKARLVRARNALRPLLSTLVESEASHD